MNLKPLYWIGLFLLVIMAWNGYWHRVVVPKEQPVFRQIPSAHVAYIHYQGPYEDMSLLFKALGKEAKFRISGHAGTLYYPTKPNQKPIYEAYIPVRKDWAPDESSIQFKNIPSANMLVFYHKGPYTTLADSYKKSSEFLAKNKISTKPVSREVYIKGPGWLFKGNPKKYVTELQFEL